MNLIDLNGAWSIRSVDGRYKLEGRVPGSLFFELEKRGELGERGVFYRENSRKCVDIADRDFVYSRDFTVEASYISSGEIFLEADGLDTLTTISINGQPLAETENMHRRYRFALDGFLREGSNRIEITFKNTLEFIREERSRRPLFAADNDGVTSVRGFNMIRKSHCSYGWDWGPKIPDLGIWRSIRVASYEGGRIDSVHITQIHKNGAIELSINPRVEIYQDGSYQINFILSDPQGVKHEFTLPIDAVSSVTVENPELWWPNGWGEQPLYNLTFELLREGKHLDSNSMRIGLRTLEIEQRPDEWGETFNFVCNGIPVFARGANYIPEDVFLNRDDPYTTGKLIRDCAAANFNCIRVWGGGIYPSEKFYNLCDENGLIVWQDLMFACAIYDVNNHDFLDNVKSEVHDNLCRIRHHACIGLICGNNEMEWGFEEWDQFTPSKEERFEYLKQYQMVFPEIIQDVCPEIFYWPASPSSGGSFESPNSPEKGDCHYWDVWHGNKDFSEYKNHFFRFMSEFGFESFPSMKTIRSFTSKEDENIFSPVMEEHQKCIGGNGKILNYISKYFKYPKDIESLAYVSQLSQAEAIRTGIEHWRRNRGRCMGAVYWQVNDNWPVASWSSIDYYGRWKALHYAASRAYNNVLISIDGDSHSVRVHLSNEGRNTVSGLFKWDLSDLSGNTLLSGSDQAEARGLTSERVIEHEFSDFLCENKDRDCCFNCCFESEDGRRYRSTHYFVPYKYLNLQDPELKASVNMVSNQIVITVTAKREAVFVEIHFKRLDAVLSDNFFNMSAGESRKVTVAAENLSVGDLGEQMLIRSLYNSY